MRALLPILLLLPLSAAAQPAKAMPLFDGFKTFCVDTGARLPAIEAAMKKTGAKLTHPLAVMTSPFQLSTEIWEIDASGRRLTIAAGSEMDPASKSFPERDFDVCTVMLSGNDAAGITALRKWIRIAPTSVTGSARSVIVEHFTWRDSGKGPAAVPKNSADYVAAEAKGEIWSLDLIRNRSIATVQLRHLLKVKMP